MGLFTITTDQYLTLMSEAIAIGRASFLKDVDPVEDEISRPRAQEMLRMRGIKPGVLEDWEKAGKIECHQASKNSTRFYSRVEILKLLNLYKFGEMQVR